MYFLSHEQIEGENNVIISFDSIFGFYETQWLLVKTGRQQQQNNSVNWAWKYSTACYGLYDFKR